MSDRPRTNGNGTGKHLIPVEDHTEDAAPEEELEHVSTGRVAAPALPPERPPSWLAGVAARMTPTHKVLAILFGVVVATIGALQAFDGRYWRRSDATDDRARASEEHGEARRHLEQLDAAKSDHEHRLTRVEDSLEWIKQAILATGERVGARLPKLPDTPTAP